MHEIVGLTALFIFALFFNIALTSYLITHLNNYGITDVPSARRAHAKETPRGGGLAICLVFILGFLIFGYSSDSYVLLESWPIIPLLFAIAAISFLDDLHVAPILVRLIVHGVCASLAVWFLVFPMPLFHNQIPYYLDFILTSIGLVAFLNIYNFLDGIDGITASETIHLTITTLVICYLKYDVIVNVDFVIASSVLILACSIGFLLFNWHPAKIFLGDVGSISIGFLLGVNLIFIAASSERLFAASAIATLYYLADGGLTLLVRIIKKEKIWEPHLNHFFQKAVKKGMSHKEVVSRISICNLFLMFCAASVLYSPAISIIVAILVVIVTLVRFI